MSEPERKRPKAIIERGLKTCTIQFVGKRNATNYENGKPISILFSMVGTFSIEPNKRFREWSFTKIVRPYKFTWMQEFGVKTVILLCDGSQTQVLNPKSEMQYGVNFEISEPKRISAKEAQTLIERGAKVVELDPNSDEFMKGDGLPITRFSKR
jgi:hypothetical protein